MNTKQVIVVRKDLKMRKGKMIAQGAHASMKAILDEGYEDTDEHGFPVYTLALTAPIDEWINGIFTKVCVGVDSEEELLAIYNKACDLDMCSSLIQDVGKTEFNGVPTYTAVAIGPAEVSDVDAITGHLKLL